MAAKRPQHYLEMEEREVRRNSSVVGPGRHESVAARRYDINMAQTRSADVEEAANGRNSKGEKDYATRKE